MARKHKVFFITLGCIVVIALGLTTRAYLKNSASEFEDHTLYSELLDEHRKFFIRLPANYDPSKTYPLIIKMDGNFNLSRWHNTLTIYAEQGIVEESILVALPNQFWTDTRNRDLVPPYARKEVSIGARPAFENDPAIFGRADVFLSFIEKELLPYLEANYSLNDNRILTGFSAGGSFVLYTLSTKPTLFDGYFAFSPAAWYDDSVVVNEFAKSLSALNQSEIFLYLSLGADENPIITGSFKGLLAALEQNKEHTITWKFSYSEGAGHNENPYVSVPKALHEYYQFRGATFSD
ncbi:alpha/beta hydrolase-fold protein [Pseudoalteromonas sp. KS88]|uniref:alpha/beta hydrolase n=1 Tax=Pseudoalteromonas sp. KS88 TaxID=2109918 RepID=UPI001AEC1B6A|nr:alpha/beta hydrolase-fold protein [Pseudoalteromonas sp. KS88]